jgi:hypothetical protein
MQKIASFGIRIGVLGALAALCTGCPNPNTYGTPRTTPVGKIQHTIAAEGIGLSWDVPVTRTTTDAAGNPTTTTSKESFSTTLPNFPTYQMRIGVADQLDVGVKLLNMSSIGADVKWNFIKSDAFDMATVPGFQVVHFSVNDAGFTQFYGNLPLLFGINVGDSVTFVPSAGVTYSFSSGELAGGNDSNSASFSEGGLWLRGGIGINFRISPKFAMHPEVTFLKNIADENEVDTLLYIFGLGFNFGNLPVYGGGAATE